MFRRRLDQLITQVRRSTENVEFSETSGISDEEMIDYANSAQDEIQGIITRHFPDVLQAEEIISSVARQEEYNLPSDAFLGNRVLFVEYSTNGDSRNYYPLKQGTSRERLTGIESDPSFYIRRSGKILLQPAPQSSAGGIRILYQKRLPSLDIRRGTVSAVSLNTSTREINSLTLDSTEFIDAEALVDENFISVVTKNGSQQMRAIPVDSVNDATGIVTVSSGFTYEEGETISVGDYVLRGTDSTTHSELDPFNENYMLEYMALRIAIRDSQTDSVELANLLQKIEASVIEAYGEIDGDVDYVTILDDQFLEAYTR